MLPSGLKLGNIAAVASNSSSYRFFNGRGQWYQPDIANLAMGMQKMYRTRARENPTGVARAKEMSWDKAVDMLVEGIEKL